MRVRLAIGFLMLAPVAAAAQTLDDLRATVREIARTDRYPLYVATFLGLTDETELSGGNFRIDGDPSTDLSVLNLPLRREIAPDAGWPGLLLEATFGYASARLDFADIWYGAAPAIATRVTVDFEAFGGFAGVGPVVPLGGGWDVAPLAVGGIAHVDSDARYEGAGATVAAALFDGILFNWEATYAIYGGSLLLRHAGWQWGATKLVPHVRYDLRRMDPLEVDDPAQDDSSTVQWLVGRLGCEGPTGWQVRGGSVDWLASIGFKAFDEESATALGFGEYLELGAGLRWGGGDLLPNWSQWQLTGAVFLGDDLTGWTLGVSLAL
jgi:hypothetical protein